MKYPILIILFGAILGALTQKRCPPQDAILPCRCLQKSNDLQIWCSHSDLPNVMDGLRSTSQFITEPIDELILENNYLPSLPGRTFLPLKVVRLMLRYNGLERVSSDWLASLEPSLMELFIVEPDLRSLPIDSLNRLERLEAVTIQTNLMKRTPTFSGLPRLKYLQIESLSLLELSPRNFRDLPRLESLHISNSPRLTRLEGGFLQDLPMLSLVNISYCGINWLHPHAFTRLPGLKEMSLVGNKFVDAGMVGRGVRELGHLEVLKLDYNYVDRIPEAAFVDLPSLKKLSLSNNHIMELDYGAFHQVPLLRTLDLNRNNVRRVHPESFLQHSGSGLEELWLVENDIRHVAELRSLLDALPRLTFLDMSFNGLESIPFGALRGHATLERLHLDYNKIHRIDREAFMAMPALRELRLKNNSLSEALEGPFWNLPALKGLDLSGNFFRMLSPRLLDNLPSLRRIDLSSNSLQVINPETFLLTPALEHVNLSHNSLTSLHPATFRHLHSLYELDVSSNDLVEFVPGLPRGIEYLHMSDNRIREVPQTPSPDLDLPSLRMLDLSGNEIPKLHDNSLRTLPQLRRLHLGHNGLQRLEEGSLSGINRLEVLDLRNNKIMQIHPNSLRDIPELRVLNLKANRIDILFPEIFRNIRGLKILDVSRNQLAEVLPGTLEKIPEIESIDASHNLLVQLPPNLVGMKELRSLDLTDNRLKDLSPETLSGLHSLTELKVAGNFINELKTGAFDNLQHLKVINMEDNELEIVEAYAVRSLPKLKSLRINNNKLRQLPGYAFNNLPSLENAELQDNELEQIAENSFNLVPHLVMLNLSNNHLGSLGEAGLKSLKSLEMLDVSRNRLGRVSGQGLDKMEWLVELRMDDNNICAVHGQPFNGMPRLRVLTMRNNRMMSFSEQAVQQLRTNIAVLDIDGNPLACACGMLWLQAWLQEGSTIGPHCQDGSLLREMRLSRQDCPPEERKVELVAPGCEAELLSVPGALGTSQVFVPWMNLKSNITQGNHLAPSPEESEYFYDEYVDYPYNETDSSRKEPITTTPKSPHLTPGDTPTIYAAPNKNKTVTSLNNINKDIPKEIQNSPSTSGFTFFGVPLPSFNFNKLWNGNSGGRGETKKSESGGAGTPVADRKAAIVNKPQRNGGRGGLMESPPGALQTFPQGPGSLQVPEDLQPPPLVSGSFRPPSPVSGNFLGPPSSPEIQTGGFVPLLPGSGGFKPITNPIRLPAMTGLEPVVLKKEDSVTSGSGTTTLEPVITKLLPQNRNVTKELTFAEEEEVTEQSAKIEEITLKLHPGTTVTPEIEVQTELLSEVSTFATTTLVPTTTSFIPTTIKTAIPSTTLRTITTTTTWEEPEPELITAESTDRSVDLAGLPKEEPRKVMATPLSALLVPGGQQPEFRPSAGRPTITKVPSPHLLSEPASAPILSEQPVSDPQPHNREEHSRVMADGNLEITGDDTSWYFANYNKTNLEPFIGSGDNVNLAAASGNKIEAIFEIGTSILLGTLAMIFVNNLGLKV